MWTLALGAPVRWSLVPHVGPGRWLRTNQLDLIIFQQLGGNSCSGTVFAGTITSVSSWGTIPTTARSTPSVSDRSLICNADTGSGSSRSGTCVGTLGGFRVPVQVGIVTPESLYGKAPGSVKGPGGRVGNCGYNETPLLERKTHATRCKDRHHRNHFPWCWYDCQ